MISYIIGIVFIILSVYCIVVNKIPLIRKYHGVKNVTNHVRIEAGAVGIIGFLMITTKILGISHEFLGALIIIICVVALILEAITNTI